MEIPMIDGTRRCAIATSAMLVLAALVSGGHPAEAHCDTLGGPVVASAKTALEHGDVTPVLMWVDREHEQEIRDVFAQVLAVRQLGKQAMEMADTYFFETLVRIHREGEGAPYTGLKPAGAVDPAVVMADRALESDSVDALAGALSTHVETGVRQRFARAAEARKHAGDSVEAGREFVEAYVQFTHYVEEMHRISTAGAAHHEEPAGDHQH
jgi:hypothetical protein